MTRSTRLLESLRELRGQCAREAERVTGRRRAVAAFVNGEAVKPCEVAAAIREIDVQQYYECAVREIERDEALLRQALDALGRARQTAMEQTLKARLPECAEFAGIAQDVDFVVAALRERLCEGDEP